MRIAALQMRAVPGDPEANLARIERAVREAAEKRVDLLIAPELAVTGYGAGDTIQELAQPAAGEMAQRLGALAEATGVAIIAGFAERDGKSVYNSALLTKGPGQSTVYRKSHSVWPLRAIALLSRTAVGPRHHLPRHEDRHTDLLRR